MAEVPRLGSLVARGDETAFGGFIKIIIHLHEGRHGTVKSVEGEGAVVW